jgi:hypothetical protein
MTVPDDCRGAVCMWGVVPLIWALIGMHGLESTWLMKNRVCQRKAREYQESLPRFTHNLSVPSCNIPLPLSSTAPTAVLCPFPPSTAPRHQRRQRHFIKFFLLLSPQNRVERAPGPPRPCLPRPPCIHEVGTHAVHVRRLLPLPSQGRKRVSLDSLHPAPSSGTRLASRGTCDGLVRVPVTTSHPSHLQIPPQLRQGELSPQNLLSHLERG